MSPSRRPTLKVNEQCGHPSSMHAHLFIELGKAPAAEEHGLQVGQHARQFLLNQLETAQRSPKLLSLVCSHPLHDSVTKCIIKRLCAHGIGLADSAQTISEMMAVRGRDRRSPTYRLHMSKTPQAMPTGCQATMMRDMASTLFVSCAHSQHLSISPKKVMKLCLLRAWDSDRCAAERPPLTSVSHQRERRAVGWTLKEVTPGRRAASGTKQLSRKMSAFCTHRSAILFSILDVRRPRVPFLTMKAFTCAQNTVQLRER